MNQQLHLSVVENRWALRLILYPAFFYFILSFFVNFSLMIMHSTAVTSHSICLIQCHTFLSELRRKCSLCTILNITRYIYNQEKFVSSKDTTISICKLQNSHWERVFPGLWLLCFSFCTKVFWQTLIIFSTSFQIKMSFLGTNGIFLQKGQLHTAGVYYFLIFLILITLSSLQDYHKMKKQKIRHCIKLSSLPYFSNRRKQVISR